MLDYKIKQFIKELGDQGLLRHKILHNSAYINFCSNDYLSLSNCEEFKSGYEEGVKRYPLGSGGSPVVSGYHQIHQTFEQTFANSLGVDDCLLFSSGYAANIGVAQFLSRVKIPILIDKKLHASFYDGFKSSALMKRYVHNDLKCLKIKLDSISAPGIVMTESIFSMGGEITPLKEIANLGCAGNHKIIVDEAHAIGILGNQGLGGVSAAGLSQKEVPLRIIPLGKAFASQGAIVAGSKEWIQALMQAARSFLYSTSISPAFTFGLLNTLKIIKRAHERRKKLQELIQYFCIKIAESHMDWENSQAPIQFLRLGCAYKTMQLRENLVKKQILCTVIRPPTVNKLETGLRICLNYSHDYADIDYLFNCLKNEENSY